MRKILITGGESCIAKDIKDYKYDNSQVYAFTKKQLNLLDLQSLKQVFDTVSFDTVIHCASVGGIDPKTDNGDVFYTNILMLKNILHFRHKYQKLITFGSAAEFNKSSDISNVLEGDEETVYPPPVDYYGLSKSVQTSILKSTYEVGVYNLRLFNCFGSNEHPKRFITTAIKNYINKQPITIFENKYFDFFYSGDLSLLINYLIKNPENGYFEYNCCYKDKLNLLDVACIINGLSDYQVPIKVNKEGEKHYTGDSYRLENLCKLANISLIGLKDGIRETYLEMLKSP